MQIVESVADATVLDAQGEIAYALRAGRRYALYDSEAAGGLRDGALRLVHGLDRTVPCYDGQPLERQRLILPFIGRLGDAIVTASCLGALVSRYPSITVDIAAFESAHGVFRLMPRLGQFLTYPIDAAELDRYDFHMSYEAVEAVPNGQSRSCADVFSKCLRTPRPTALPVVTIPPDAHRRWAMRASERPYVALHVGRKDNVRSYPPDLLADLTSQLVGQGFEVVLIGSDDTVNLANPAAPHVRNLVGSTETPADLAAVLGQMNALITGDSFPMHLAGLLGVPTLALFGPTHAVLGSDYPSVTSLQSEIECSPCHVANAPCPLGHRDCIALRSASLDPKRIAERIGSVLTSFARS